LQIISILSKFYSNNLLIVRSCDNELNSVARLWICRFLHLLLTCFHLYRSVVPPTFSKLPPHVVSQPVLLVFLIPTSISQLISYSTLPRWSGSDVVSFTKLPNFFAYPDLIIKTFIFSTAKNIWYYSKLIYFLMYSRV